MYINFVIVGEIDKYVDKMNKSKYINPKKCRTCGDCCKSFSIIYEKEIEKVEPNMFSEVERFKYLNSNGKIEVKEEETYFEVIFNFPCKCLIEKDGVYSCIVYNNRPLLCEEFPYENTTKQDCPMRN
jgi:Fe-S-cluster containining protein